MHKKILLLLLSAAVLFDFNGCVSMSAQARRERAYRHYVQKQMKQRRRETARAQKAANRQLKEKMKLAKTSEPQVTTSVGDVSSASFSEPTSEQVATPPASDQVVPPVTVSASNEIMATQNPDQPSPP